MEDNHKCEPEEEVERCIDNKRSQDAEKDINDLSSKILLAFPPNPVTNITWLQAKTCVYICVCKWLFHEGKKKI